MRVAAILILGVVATVQAWDYTTQGADWTDLGSCDGMRQSPIDIIREETIPYTFPPNADGPGNLQFSPNYCEEIEGEFIDDGHTIKFQDHEGLTSSNYITGGPLGAKKYHFWQFHLHWNSPGLAGQGSEHMIDNQGYPAELHLVHVNEDHINLDGSVNATALEAPFGLSVIGIFLLGSTTRRGTRWFDTIASAAEDLPSNATMDLNNIIHALNPSYNTDFNYYSYAGSLTTPDCNEAVAWIVAERPLRVTTCQLNALYALNYDDNYRVVQPSLCRKVASVSTNSYTSFTYEPRTNCEFGLSSDGVNCFPQEIEMAEGDIANVSSNNFPGSYPNNEYQLITITVPEGKAILLDFENFDTERCCDTLNVYDGAGTCDGFITDFYGSNGAWRSNVPNLVASQSNQMTLFFYTDGSVTSSGWNASISIGDPGNCGQNFTEASGKLFHPGSPGVYLDFQDCGYLITVTPGSTIQLSWDVFDIESGWDYVYVYDGPNSDATQLQENTGNDIPDTITSSTNELYVHFFSDYSVQEYGFAATYTTVTP